jgi:hypothetical protein
VQFLADACRNPGTSDCGSGFGDSGSGFGDSGSGFEATPLN